MTRGDLEEEPEKLVKSFHNHLKQQKRLSEETASGHAHQISFFALHYLIGYEGKSLLEVTSTDIEDYKKDRKEYSVNHGCGIEWFAITKLGKKIFGGIR